MSFVKIDNDIIDSLTIELHPSYKYTSKTESDGTVTTTGAINVKARGDKVLKDVYEVFQAADYDEVLASTEADTHVELYFDSSNYEKLLQDLQRTTEIYTSLGTTDVSYLFQTYMNNDSISINNRPLSYKNDVQIKVARFDPPFEHSYESTIKNVIKDNLMKEHIIDTDNCDFSFTNYNSINFFTSDTVPSDSVIMYPTPLGSGDDDHELGRYIPDGAFSMDFYINPRYNESDSSTKEFKAGTIMHLSSTYALSLVSGSQKDENGRASAFKIMLQLSHSADITPSEIDTTITNNTRSYPDDLIFISEDNSLKLNNWHHVTVRWGTETVNFGSGSIRIDDTSETYFNVPSSSITPVIADPVKPNDVLFIGNYYEGENREASVSETSRFFYGGRSPGIISTGVVDTDGLAWENNNYEFANPGHSSTYIEMDSSLYTFNHPLNAEIQELKLYSKYLNTGELRGFATSNPSDFVMSGSLMFYLPPSFVKESPLRHVRASNVDVKQNTDTTNSFNSRLSFKSNVREICLENYFRDFRAGIYPRFFNMSISHDNLYNPSTEEEKITIDKWCNSIDKFRKRNLTILPSDNGLFNPSFKHLLTGSYTIDKERIIVESWESDDPKYTHPMKKFQNNQSVIDLSKITLLNTLENSGIGLLNANYWESKKEEESLSAAVAELIEWIPEYTPDILDMLFEGSLDSIPIVSETDLYPMYQEYRDDSSNEVTIFDITNLSYGNCIQKNTFSLYDSSLRGSDGKVNMTLKDNGRGSLYRADCLTKHATWNNVGNVFYDEGIAIVKAPTIPHFGKDQFELNLKGTQNLHVMTIDAKAKKGYINKSTNSSYLPVSASFDINNPDNNFVYISGINYHDENLNVIMRTNLTQPIKKKEEDEFVFRTKFDW